MSKDSGLGYMQAPSSDSTHIYLWLNALYENEIDLSPCEMIVARFFLPWKHRVWMTLRNSSVDPFCQY